MANENPANVRIRVRVHRARPGGSVRIESTHALPAADEVIAQLPTPARRWANEHRYGGISLENLITYCGQRVRVAQWQQAIANATASHVQEAAAPALEMIVHTAPAYFVAGNAIYKLEAVEWRDTGRATLLSAIRRRIIADAEEHKARIIQESKRNAERIRAQANRDATNITISVQAARQELGRLRQELLGVWRPPAWLGNHAIPIITLATGGCKVFMPLHLRITRFFSFYQNLEANRNEIRVWRGRGQRATTIPCWFIMQMDGSYSHESFHLDSNVHGELPHMDRGHACQTIADAPPILNSWDAYNDLQRALNRTMSEVNLNSLLCAYGDWNGAAKRAVPDSLRQHFMAPQEHPMDSITPDAVEEEQETFYAPPERPTTIAEAGLDPAEIEQAEE